MVLVRTTAPGMPGSRWMNHEYALFPRSRLTRRLMGTMVENRTRNRMIFTYHTLPAVSSKPSSATRMTDRAKVKAQRILVSELISYSSSPVLDLEGAVERADRVCGPV